MNDLALRAASTVQTTAHDMHQRVQKRIETNGNDAGLSTLEISVIGAGLLAAATALVLLFNGAIATHSAPIQ